MKLKELEKEYLEDLDHYDEGMGIHSTSYEKCKERLIRLAKIENSKPSEALECFDKIYNTINLNWNNDLLRVGIDVRNRSDCYDDKEMANCLDTIKQVLLKSQEQEKEIAYIEKIKTMMKQRDCVLRYIESEDCFAVRTILSDGWYRLTPEFIENNVREEIKPLPLIEKNKQLKEENAEYKRVLEVIKEKKVDIKLIMWAGNMVEAYNQKVREQKDYWWREELTQEEFDLLKRWFK